MYGGRFRACLAYFPSISHLFLHYFPKNFPTISAVISHLFHNYFSFPDDASSYTSQLFLSYFSTISQ